MGMEKINSWLTLTANTGVVLGLVFLGIEIRQSRIATEAATYQARSTEIQEANQNFALSDYMPEIYDRLEAEGIESLDTVQVRRLFAWETARVQRIEAQIQLFNLGLLDEDTVSRTLAVAASSKLLWDSLGISIRPQLQKALDNRDQN